MLASDLEAFSTHLAVSIPDLIAIDLSLPEGGGAQLCQRLRANRRLDDVPLIVMSSAGERELAAACLRSGADDVLDKPFSQEEFSARLKNLLVWQSSIQAGPGSSAC